MRILLWRHGRTAWNNDGRFQGQADEPLDATGQAQALSAAPGLVALRPTLVVSSDLMRCQATAATLGLPFRTDPRLREIDLGEWSGLTAAEAAERFPEENLAWRRGEDVRRGGGETYGEVGARAMAVVHETIAGLGAQGDDALIVLVTHGGTARSLLGLLLEMPPSLWYRFGPLGNCRWSIVSGHEGGFRLLEHNSGPVSHVEGPPNGDGSAWAVTSPGGDGQAVHLRSGS